MTSSLLTLLGSLLLAPHLASATDYFFRFSGGNSIIHSQRLRGNFSIPLVAPGVAHAPYNPQDHYNRIYVNETQSLAKTSLYIVPTNPHPPPVPGYYALWNVDGIPDVYRLVQTYWPEGDSEGRTFLYKEWNVRKTGDGDGSRTLLRYGCDLLGEWRWIAVREVNEPAGGNERWVPYWVRPTAGNMEALAGWEYDVVDLELVLATGPVNSNAPGGVEE